MPKTSKPDNKALQGRSRKVTFLSPTKNAGKKLTKRKKKKQLKISGKSLDSLQAVVTSAVEPCTLPPSVQGPLRGTLVITIGQVDWRLPMNPPETLAIRLRWWGESTHKTLYPPIIHEGQIIQSINTNPICSVNYAIKSGPKQFKTYLQDTGSLMLDALEDHGKVKKLIAQGSIVNIESLLDKDVITDVVPLYDNKRRQLANLRVKAKLTMIGVLQKESFDTNEFSMIPSALNNDLPIPIFSKPKPFKQVRISRPDPDLLLSPDRERSLEDSPEFVTPPKHTIVPKFKSKLFCEPASVETLIGSSNQESGSKLSHLISKGEALRDEMVHLLESRDELRRPETTTLPVPPIDPIIGLLLPEDQLHPTVGYAIGEYNQFLEESLVNNPSLIEDILYLNGGTSLGNDRILNELEIEFGGELEFNDSVQDYETAVLDEMPIQDKSRKSTPLTTNHQEAISCDSTELSYASIRDRLGTDRVGELERVYAAKVLIEKLIFNSHLELMNRRSPAQLSRIYRSTYVVEYQLEQHEGTVGEKRARRVEEGTRVVTRKVDGDGNIIFNHRTVVPICLTGGVIKKWWNGKLEFKIYKKNLGQKKAVYLGAAVINLRSVLESEDLAVTSSLAVEVPTHLEREQYPSHLDATIELATEPLQTQHKHKQIEFVSKDKHVTFSNSPPEVQEISPHSEIQEPEDIITSGANSLRLHLLLLVPDGSGISVSSRECPWRGVNPYLVAKLFCADPAPQSSVHWESGAPKFAFRQLFPIQLTHNILTTRLCNKVVVLEVWHRETNRNKPGDELIGLVQLSLHQFYINFTHPENAAQSLQGQYPVISENGCYAITDPLTGRNRGYLSALLALGSLEQIEALEQNISEGAYSIKTASKKESSYQEQPDVSANLYLAQEGAYPRSADHIFSEDSEHVFEICIEGAKDVHPLGSGVWGETDCYVSYKFPISTRHTPESQIGEDQVELTTFSTPTTLSLPAPNFSAHHTHKIFIKRGTSLQQILLDSTYQGREERLMENMPWRPQLEFELWRRYYYPDTQNHLLARGYLPTAKVCEMVTQVQHEGSFTVKTFTLPLHLAESEQNFSTHYTDNTNCGQLDLTVRYKLVKLDPEYSPTDPTIQPSRYHPQVYVKIQIKQATGLRDAVELASLSNTDISLSELETGVNTYVTIRFSFTKKTHTTKAIAATFSPTYSYEIELPLSLSQSVIDNHSPVSLAEIIAKSTINFQIWHVPLSARNTPQNRTHTQLPHVILGECSLPFEMLLIRSTGMKGWYSLKPPNGKGSKCVGALDLNVEFSSIQDREKVLYEANKFGYQIDRPCKFDSLQLEPEQNLEIDINIRRLWIAKQPKGSNHCYLRYRFYDKTTTISQTFSPRRNEGNRMVFDTEYKKSCQVYPSSAFEWYLQEERLELQVWQTKSKSTVPVIPSAEDNLLGTACVNLHEMCGFYEYQEPQIAGVYPLFRAGVTSLGGNCVEIEISIHQPTEIQMLERNSLTAGESTRGEIQDSIEELDTELPTGIPVIFAVDRAAHLSCLPSLSGFLHVTVHAETLLFQTSRIELVNSPVWNFQQEIHINEEIFSPVLGLEVKLWYSAEFEAIQSQLVGVAKVDLSPLKCGLPELAGWYNLSNVLSSCQGQIKLRAIPRERMEVASSLKIPHQRNEWVNTCALIDNPVLKREPIVLQEVDIDLTGVDANVTGSFLMRRLKSSLADLENVQANFRQNLQPKTVQATPPDETESIIDLCSSESVVLEDTYPTMDTVNELLEEINELPIIVPSPENSLRDSSSSETSEPAAVQQTTEDIGVNTTAFSEVEFHTESNELPLIQETTFSRNSSPILSEDDEYNSQEPQIIIENNNPHYILEADYEPSPRSLTDVSSVSDFLQSEQIQEAPDEDILSWVDSVTQNVPALEQQVTITDDDVIPTRAIITDEKGNLKINIPEDIQVPNFFMPPDALIENMRNLRMKAMSQFPQTQHTEDTHPNPTVSKPSVHLTTPLLPWEANRINKIFLGKV